MSKRVLILGLVACGLILAAGPTKSQETFDVFSRKGMRSYFIVDHAEFKSEIPGKVHLELYYQIYNTILNFTRKDNLYEAEYELAVKVYNDDDELIDSYRQSKTVTVPNEVRARSKYDYRTSQVNFDLLPGKYTVDFILSDPSSRAVESQHLKLKLKDPEQKKPSLSDIELAQAVDTVHDSGTTEFDKGDLMIIPSVTHVFGNDDKLRLLFYVELYQGTDSAKDVRVETKLRHDVKGMVYRDSLTTEFTHPVVKQFRSISLDSLIPGHYELSVTLMTPRRKKIDVEYRDFTIFWSQNALLKFDYKSVLGQLAIIADHQEMELLKKPEDYEDRLAAFNAFWDGRDPTPGTVVNEAKNEFYRRVNIANQNFTHMYRQGWRTDRGRVYIMYGEPDQVDDYPVVPDRHPYQEWHYYRGTKYRKFIFVDVNEDGDYRLEYPYDGLYQQPD
jgi:GWxTD domain-containing protein